MAASLFFKFDKNRNKRIRWKREKFKNKPKIPSSNAQSNPKSKF
jgi:hypothetical protein